MAASYPGAVKTFATRTSGQSIDPAHINDLQDEVNAIESGLLNGTAPVNSSRIVATGLQVTGNSTVAALSVTGVVSFDASAVIALSSGDNHNVDVSTATVVYLLPSTSGSTITGLAGAAGKASVKYLVNQGAVSVGIKNLAGSISTNQFYLPSGDTSFAPGAVIGVLYRPLAGLERWGKF